MRIRVHNRARQFLFEAQVDPRQPPSIARPAEGSGPEAVLHWEQAIDDRGILRRCPVCGCRELFVRKDFPQRVGLIVVIANALTAMILFVFRQAIWAYAILIAAVLVDALIYFLLGRCLVCYDCRSEFRDLPIGKEHQPWDLSVGEKYRHAQAEASPSNAGDSSAKTTTQDGPHDPPGTANP